ncbi:CU044_5270 family protein [Streptomyces luteireticuli]|uniref:CU044_5270 family protein n=1 Tax=Streptomyces luteireticuli TaxID=173858 RepID=A0ABN0Z6V2_9ACTN
MKTPEHQDLAELLPAPAERDLPPHRHRHHKERLLHAIDADRRSPAFVRRLARPAFAVPLAATAVAGALVVTTLTGGHDGSRPPAERVPLADAGPQRASVLLDRIAAVALKSGTKPVRDDQYVYVRSVATETVHIKPVEAGGLKQREDWFSQESRPSNDVGVFREDGKFVTIHGADNHPAGIDRPTYQWLASLPTDPDALYQRLRKETRPIKGVDFDQTVFDTIGTLLWSGVMPPRTEAALYKAAAKIPGVVTMRDAADADGRHGVAIAREDRQLGQRTEWVFDKKSLTYLGQRTYLTRTDEWGKAGTLVRATAILERAVVDRARQIP